MIAVSWESQLKTIINTFGRYLSKEVVEELLHSPEGLKLGGEIPDAGTHFMR
jgi:hypothetical protein